MARADTPRLLSLDRYAKIMGVNPAHFNGASNAELMPVGGQCQDIWFQFDWQAADRVSRETLARYIADAEREIAEHLGFWPGPTYCEEVHRYPQFHRPDEISFPNNLWNQFRSVKADYGKFIEAGRRAVTLIETATEASGALSYDDDDGDGHNETATILVATTFTNPCEIKVFFSGENGDPAWEIREPKSITVSGGFATIKFFAWQLIDPSLWDALATDEKAAPIDFLNVNNLVDQVDVYRVFTDFTQVSSKFFWERQPRRTFGQADFIFCNDCNGNGCPSCTLQVQDGCLHVRDLHNGALVPQPASFDSLTNQWNELSLLNCRSPDLVKIWYYAGDLDRRFLNGQTCEALPLFWAEAIAWLATARLMRPFCSCGPVEKLVTELQWDTARSGPDEPTFTLDLDDARNPFGTRLGEVRAWRRVAKSARIVPHVAVV